MKGRMGFLLFGAAFGYCSQNIYNFYTPSLKNVSQSSRQLIENYVSKNNLQQAHSLLIYKGLALMWKSFYCYGLQEKLGGFNFSNTFIKKQESDGKVKNLYYIFSPTQYLCGHPEIQHGGATASIMIQNMANLGIMYSRDIVATGKLSTQYKKPVRKDQYYVLEIEVEKQERRKVFLKGQVKNLETGELIVKSQGIFIVVGWDHKMGRILKKTLQFSSPKADSQKKIV